MTAGVARGGGGAVTRVEVGRWGVVPLTGSDVRVRAEPAWPVDRRDGARGGSGSAILS
ncbi:MAG: hypothetical protein ACRDTF_18360 [Pseudonocardiaceae bacterium]